MNNDIEQCPYFNKCSQNLCPLDAELELRTGNKYDVCRYMREPRQTKIKGRVFVSGGSIMEDALLNLVPESNVSKLNEASRTRWQETQKNAKHN